MPRIVIGLDFGTSNTSVSYADLDGDKTIKTVALETSDDGKSVYKTTPSAMFYIPRQKRLLTGRKAINAYINHEDEGRLLRNLKSVLDKVDDQTKVSEELPPVPYFNFIYNFLKRVTARVIAESGSDNIVGIVVGRPVHFFDDDEERDKKAEQNLRRIVERIGFKNIVFLEEPIAASFSLETKIPTDTVAFVADIGGGTSDFAAIALGPSYIQHQDRRKDVFATTGIRVGGTDFDKSFSLARFMPELGFGTRIKLQNNSETDFPKGYFDKLSNAFSINELYDYGVIAEIEQYYLMSLAKPRINRLLHIIKVENGHNLITEVETCKKGLSYKTTYTFNVKKAFALSDDSFITREDLEGALSKFKKDTENYLSSKDASKLLDDIKSKLQDYKNQCINRENEYSELFGKDEDQPVVQQCKEQINNIVCTSLENWMKNISSISLNDIKKEIEKHKDAINKINNDKVEQDLNNLKNTGEFNIKFEPDYKIGYKVFDELLEIKLPKEEIQGILEKAKDIIVKNIKYKEELFRQLSAELTYSVNQKTEAEVNKLGIKKDTDLYNEKLQQQTVEEYKKLKGKDAFYEKREKVIEEIYKSTVNRFITSITKLIFVECALLDERDTLLQNIKDLIHVFELSIFNLPDINTLEAFAIKIGAIYQDIVINRKEFIYSIEQHMEKLKRSINECIKKSGKDKSEFKYLIMTGGSSRIPKVKETIKECFNEDIKIVCEDLSNQENVEDHHVMENIDTPDDISVGLCMYGMNVFK